MTGLEIINRALVELQSEGSRQLEAGITLQQFLEVSLNLVVSDVFAMWAFEWALNTPTPVPTIGGTSVYTLPTGMIEVFDIILDTGAIDTRKLTRLPLRTFKTKWAAQAYLPMDKPYNWCQVNDTQFQVAPTPNSAYDMTLTGTVAPAAISDFALPVTIIPLRDHEVLVYGIAKRGAEAIKDPVLPDLMTKSYVQIINRMIQEDKRMPDVEYQLQPFRASPQAQGTNYWANPFVGGI
jgi:hypothetical protein